MWTTQLEEYENKTTNNKPQTLAHLALFVLFICLFVFVFKILSIRLFVTCQFVDSICNREVN